MAKIKDLRAVTPRTNGTRKLSAIKNIARHYSATKSGNWAAFWNHWNGKLGWGTGGYHEIILPDGTVELCYDPEEITNGVGGQNSYIYNICLVSDGNFTAAQEKAWEERARYWMKRLNLTVSAVKGHNEFPGQSTACPGINMNMVRARLKGQSSSSNTGVYHLEYGDKGNKVKEYQEKLKRGGYKIDIDSSFGPAMKSVVQKFQRDHGLAVDGLLGPATQKKLNEILIKKKGDEEQLNLNKSERAEIARIFKHAREKGIFASAEHEKAIVNGTMTLSRLQYLQTIIAGAGINNAKRV